MPRCPIRFQCALVCLPLVLWMPVHADIIRESARACVFLRQRALRPSSSDLHAVARARTWSGVNAPIYIDPPFAIDKVAHLPGAPFLTAIAGRRVQCVAAAPQWLERLDSTGRSWLLMGAIAGLRDRRTYDLMLKASGHHRRGVFAEFFRWWARRRSHGAILRFEHEATTWLPAGRKSAAGAALQKLRDAPGFRDNPWMPNFAAQLTAVR